MNIFALIGQNASGTFSDDSLGGPVQRVMNSHFVLTNAIAQANRYNNPTRAARLLALKTSWTSKAEMLFFYPIVGNAQDPSAVQHSLNLANEVSAALAVSD